MICPGALIGRGVGANAPSRLELDPYGQSWRHGPRRVLMVVRLTVKSGRRRARPDRPSTGSRSGRTSMEALRLTALRQVPPRQRSKMSRRSPRNMIVVVNREQAPFAAHFQSLPREPEHRSLVTHQLCSGVILCDLIERKGEGL
jgi:hypothetical protein